MEANAQAMVSDRVVTAEPVSFLSLFFTSRIPLTSLSSTDVRDLQFGNVA